MTSFSEFNQKYGTKINSFNAYTIEKIQEARNYYANAIPILVEKNNTNIDLLTDLKNVCLTTKQILDDKEQVLIANKIQANELSQDILRIF